MYDNYVKHKIHIKFDRYFEPLSLHNDFKSWRKKYLNLIVRNKNLLNLFIVFQVNKVQYSNDKKG